MRFLLILFCVMVAATGRSAAAGTLHRREVNQSNPGGKDLVMTFEELRRDEKVSLAKVTYVSGASVASSMFIVRGFYDIARVRGAAYFIKRKEWEAEDGSWTYLVGFCNDKSVTPNEYFGLREPVDHQFMAVSDFDLIFKFKGSK